MSKVIRKSCDYFGNLEGCIQNFEQKYGIIPEADIWGTIGDITIYPWPHDDYRLAFLEDKEKQE